jgi:hypothetical protein
MHHTAVQGLEQWQQPLAKIAIDQTVLSLAWNSMYFGMLGAMRLDPPGQVRPLHNTSCYLGPCLESLIWMFSAAVPATPCLSLCH